VSEKLFYYLKQIFSLAYSKRILLIKSGLMTPLFVEDF